MSPAKLATTAPVSVPAASVVATPVSVATPLLLVTAVPTGVPSRVKLTVSPEIPWLVTEDVSVAVRVAVPPKAAVPATLPSVVAAWLTTRSPVALAAACSWCRPRSWRRRRRCRCPTASVVATPVSVATPLLLVTAVPTRGAVEGEVDGLAGDPLVGGRGGERRGQASPSRRTWRSRRRCRAWWRPG